MIGLRPNLDLSNKSLLLSFFEMLLFKTRSSKRFLRFNCIDISGLELFERYVFESERSELQKLLYMLWSIMQIPTFLSQSATLKGLVLVKR